MQRFLQIRGHSFFRIDALRNIHLVGLRGHGAKLGVLGKRDEPQIGAGIFAHQVAQHGLAALQRFARHARRRVHQHGDGQLLYPQGSPGTGQRDHQRGEGRAFQRETRLRCPRHLAHPDPQDRKQSGQHQENGLVKRHSVTCQQNLDCGTRILLALPSSRSNLRQRLIAGRFLDFRRALPLSRRVIQPPFQPQRHDGQEHQPAPHVPRRGRQRLSFDFRCLRRSQLHTLRGQRRRIYGHTCFAAGRDDSVHSGFRREQMNVRALARKRHFFSGRRNDFRRRTGKIDLARGERVRDFVDGMRHPLHAPGHQQRERRLQRKIGIVRIEADDQNSAPVLFARHNQRRRRVSLGVSENGIAGLDFERGGIAHADVVRADPPRHRMLQVPSRHAQRPGPGNRRAAEKPNRIERRLRGQVRALIDRDVRRNVCAEFRRQNLRLHVRIARKHAEQVRGKRRSTARKYGHVHRAERRKIYSGAVVRLQRVGRTDFRLQHSALVPCKFIFRVGERFRSER